MKFKGLTGQSIEINIGKYVLDWNKTSNKSKPQLLVESFLRPYWEKDRVLTEFKIPGRMRIDLLNINKKIAIEISPSSSHSFNKFFHKDNRLNFLAAVKRDAAKQEWIEKNGFTYVELGDNHLKNLSVELFVKEFNIHL